MRMLTFLWFILWANYADRFVVQVSSADQDNNGFLLSQVQNIFILAGQSNMSGRGGVDNETWDGVVPIQSHPNSSILRLSAELTWVEARDPLHRDIDVNATCGVGPGMAFAKAMLERDPSLGVIGLVPCAIGGTRISEWGRGSALYAQLMRRAEAALQGGGTIRALLWYQGESDTVTHEEAKLYKMRLERFFAHVRADLHLPALPIIQVALASGQGPYIETVREAQLGFGLHQLPNVKCIDGKGLSLEPDNLHLTTPAQLQLGVMFADTFLQSLPLPAQSSSSSAAASRRLHNFFFLNTVFQKIRSFLDK